MTLLDVMICVNDRHGNDTGRVEQIHVFLPDGELVELEGPRLSCKQGALPAVVRIGDNPYPIHRHRCHIGNIYWDAVGMSAPTVLRLLGDLRRAGWGCNAAPVELFDAWHNGQTITEEMLEDVEG